ncbi:hypothetical protein HMPREF0773_10107 [Staphylococcus aureus subsp. aureus TCH70]|nr:hypothetical protein HMPREF0782_2658 [Staphylococcus aureus subsp. aureus ATCC 51811]EFK83479.1 hypothetical protein HMPREF0773_10107 [Staphylococcus aureus subsp. aureus TCH70]EFM08036.1 hypothetical protein HMPREF0783_0306 [Staphylococcus aureus subsp. aureus ATCC BAA-39]
MITTKSPIISDMILSRIVMTVKMFFICNFLCNRFAIYVYFLLEKLHKKTTYTTVLVM